MKNCQDCLDSLSEFADGALAPAVRSAVEHHLEACGACRTALEDLRAVCRAVSSLGREPLPAGFMSRLESRRQGARPAPAVSPWRLGLTGVPARAFAFAAASLVVAVVVWDRVRPMTFERSFSTQFAADVALNATPKEVLQNPASDVLPGRKLAPAKGRPIAFAPAERRQNPVQAMPASFGRASGAGMGALRGAAAAESPAAAYSNDELQRDLELQRRRMGIREIAAKQSAEEKALARLGAGLAGAPAELDATLLSNKPAPAPIAGATPALLKAEEAGGPLDGKDKRDAGALAPAADAAPAAAGGSAPAATTGFVLRSDAERSAFWQGHKLHAKAPAVNYERDMIVLVMAGSARAAVEILSVKAGTEAIVVRYRESPLPDRAEDAPRSYQYRPVKRSVLPVRFEKQP